MAGRLVLLLRRQWGGSFGSSKVGRGLATKLHPHLIELGLYVATEVESNRRKETSEQMEWSARGRERS